MDNLNDLAKAEIEDLMKAGIDDVSDIQVSALWKAEDVDVTAEHIGKYVEDSAKSEDKFMNSPMMLRKHRFEGDWSKKEKLGFNAYLKENRECRLYEFKKKHPDFGFINFSWKNDKRRIMKKGKKREDEIKFCIPIRLL